MLGVVMVVLVGFLWLRFPCDVAIGLVGGWGCGAGKVLY